MISGRGAAALRAQRCARAVLASLAVLFAAAAPSAWAGATLHIGSGFGSACETGGCPVFGGEVNPIGVSLDIFQQSGGAPDLIDPVLLILGVPNDSVSSPLLNASAVISASIVDGATHTSTPITFDFGTSAFGLSAGGFHGVMTSGEVYGFLGIGSQANNSNSFNNWHDWDLAVDGINASNFGIYVFAFHPMTGTGAFGAHDFLDIDTQGVPIGTFAVGYGQDSRDRMYSTPFTEAGLVTKVLEPNSLALVGLGLMALAFVGRRKAS